MTSNYQPIGDLLARVRTRWRWLVALQAFSRGAAAAAALLAVALLVAANVGRAPRVLAAIAALALVLVVGVLAWALRSLRHAPSDSRLARFIEERQPELDERLVSAVGVASVSDETAPRLAASMIGDAARAISTIAPADIVSSESLRRATFQAAAAVFALGAVVFAGRHVVHRSTDAMSLALFPSRIELEVTPGDARVQAGSTLKVEARLVGNSAPVVAQLLRADGDGDPGEGDWRATEMAAGNGGGFELSLNALVSSFRYRVVAGTVSSKTFNVAVLRPPRVARIDVEYTYPKAVGLAPRTEQDAGDIYAPVGTSVRVIVHTDTPAASGRLMLGGSQTIELSGSGRVLNGALEIVEDNSYRVALADAEGMSSRGDTEYFIRTLDDRPPEVHVVKPASDRRVTLLEEVDIEAEAEDDFGIASMDLVYAVRGRTEKVVPLGIPARSTSVSARHVLYLEDLDVRPGDFVSYYVRARDLARGKRSSEARSDMFFLEVKPFEEEFTLAQSQAAMGGGQSNQQLDDLVAAQKQVIVATWKLDRRSQSAKGAQSAEDIKAVARAENELKTRVQQASSVFRQSTMREPRRPIAPGRGAPPPPPLGPRAGQTLAEEDAMSAAATAMGDAVTALNALKTADAMSPEMEALNHLLKAQADVKKRQVQQQQAASGSGSNRATQDLSSLFDKELARQQQTNYEAPKNADQGQQDEKASEIDKIKDLARRQDELLKRQQELARERERMSAEQLKRELESLTREQNDLRQRAEELAQEMARRNQSGQDAQPSQNQPGQRGQQAGQQSQGQSGQQQGQGQQSQAGRAGQPGQSGERRPAESSQAQGQSGREGQNGRDMRAISEEMRGAADDLRRQDADQARARASRALDQLRELERQLQGSTPDARRRALGDLQLEARQLADAQRQVASDAKQAGPGEGGKDDMRRLAGEQQRLADRLRRVEDGLKQASGSPTPGGNSADARRLQQAAAEAARELERQRLGEKMQQSADAMRAASQPDARSSGTSPAPGAAPSQEEIARALDRIADRLSSADRSDDPDARRISEQIARAQELRERLDDLTRQLGELDRQNQPNGDQPGAPQNGRESGQRSGQTSQQSPQSAPGETGRSGRGQAGAGGASADVEQLRDEANREIARIRELLRETERAQGTQQRGGIGATFEGQGMTLSAPGTEAFKQDFAKWQELKRQATAALEQVESTLSKQLQEREAKDRLSSGADDKAPAAYQNQVDSYFKALATRKKP